MTQPAANPYTGWRDRRSVFSRLRSAATLGVIVAVPSLLCLLLMAVFTVGQFATLARSGVMLEQMQAAERFGAAIHALQKERGASAGFIGSEGAAFGDALPGLRADSDAALEALTRTLAAVDLDAMPPAVGQDVATLRRGLGDLAAVRRRVDALDVAIPEQVAFYTGLIRAQLSAVTRSAEAAATGGAAVDLVRYATVMEAKERMGIARAVGSAGFGRGAFTPEEWRRLIELLSARGAFLSMFDAYADGPMAARRAAMAQAPAQARFDAMLAYAVEIGPGAPLDRFTGPDWFDAATGVIDGLHALERATIDGARAHVEDGRRSVIVTMAAIDTPLLALIGLAFWLTRSAAVSMSGSLRWVATRLAALADGDIDSPIRAGASNELGAIAGSMIRLCEAERDARAERARRAADDAARNEAERSASEDRIAALRVGVGAANAALTALADGDLTARMEGRFDGEFAELQGRIDTTVAALRDAVGRIRQSAAAIAGNAGEAAAGAQDMSARAEGQAASLEEVAASMETLAHSVRDNADRAATAQAEAKRARASAAEGAATAQQAVAAMRRTEEASAKITEMVSVIEGFAFQTGLLAVNAAVEAARAGETGKGFAVVAQEVRSLADRSSAAARNVADIVGAANARAAESVGLIEAAGAGLDAISGSIAQLADAVAQIAVASRDQAEEVESVAQATGGLQRATEDAAALAERSARVAGALDGEVASLDAAIARFRGDDRAARRAA